MSGSVSILEEVDAMWHGRILVAVGIVVGLVVTACGSGSQGPSSDAETLNVTNASTDLTALPMFVAQSRDLFAKQGLTVNFSAGTASTRSAILSSGKTDLIYDASGVGVGLTLKGRPVVDVFGLAALAPTTELWSGTIDSIQDANGLDECTIATTPTGGSTYGYASYWNQHFGLKCQIAVVQDYQLIVAGVKSGTYTMGTVPVSTIATRPDGVNVLIGQNAPDYPQLPGGDKAVIAGLLGMPDNLEGKRDEVVRFIRGMIEAQAIVDQSSPDQLVADVRSVEIFKAVPEDTLREQIAAAKKNIWKDPTAGGKVGYISPEVWSASLTAMSYFGIEGFDPNDPRVGYSKLGDMSFYDAAEKL
ncbi:ABC transporter substrate-binding protein [Rhodococcus koreensis]